MLNWLHKCIEKRKDTTVSFLIFVTYMNIPGSHRKRQTGIKKDLPFGRS